MLITRKIEIYFNSETKEEYDEYWIKLRDLERDTFKAANFIVNNQFFNEIIDERLLFMDDKTSQKRLDIGEKISDIYKKKSLSEEESKKQRDKLYKELNELTKESRIFAKDFYLKSKQNSTYELITKEFPNLGSYVASSLNQSIVSVFNNDMKEIRTGKRTVRNYKKGMPIPFMKTGIIFQKIEDKYHIKWIGKFNFIIKFGRDRSNNKAIIDKVLSAEYSFSDSSVQIKDNKIFLLLIVNIPDSVVVLDKNICVGVDLGLNIPVYLALNNGFERQALGDRESFLKFRVRMQQVRRRLQQSLKLTAGGKGRDKKMKALDNSKANEKKFATTYNHQITAEIIKFALKHNAGIIKMENLKGIAQDEKNSFILRNWSYFQLQQFVEYKAKRNNIEIKYINPKYTSQMCSYCENREDGQRLSQSEFLCKNPDCTNKDDKNENLKINADFNAARNIAKSEKYS